MFFSFPEPDVFLYYHLHLSRPPTHCLKHDHLISANHVDLDRKS